MTRAQAETKAEALSLETLTNRDLIELFQQDREISSALPEKQARRHPASGLPILYSPARGHRPRTHGKPDRDCPICGGNITVPVDIWTLDKDPEEFGFINKNLYPAVFPFQDLPPDKRAESSWGLHFLLWPSCRHQQRFATLPPRQACLSLERLALLEKILLNPSGNDSSADSSRQNGFFNIIKNEGSAVGGSIAHDHFQMIYTLTEPLSFRQDRFFLQHHPAGLADYLRQNMPPSLILGENKDWILGVNPFMSRPGELLLLPRENPAAFLHTLSFNQLMNLTELLQTILGWAPLYFNTVFPSRQVAFNLVFHNSGAGAFFVEYLPFTQNNGGYEKQGFYICQDSPEKSAQFYKDLCLTNQGANEL